MISGIWFEGWWNGWLMWTTLLTRDKEQISGLKHTLVPLCLHKLRKPFQIWGVNVHNLRLITLGVAKNMYASNQMISLSELNMKMDWTDIFCEFKHADCGILPQLSYLTGRGATHPGGCRGPLSSSPSPEPAGYPSPEGKTRGGRAYWGYHLWNLLLSSSC